MPPGLCGRAARALVAVVLTLAFPLGATSAPSPPLSTAAPARTTGPDGVTLLRQWIEAALAARARGDAQRAAPLWERILAAEQQLLGVESRLVASTRLTLADTYRQLGRYEEAEAQSIQALETYRKLLGVEHRLYATALNNLAVLYQDQARYAEAEPLLQQALSRDRASRGSADPASEEEIAKDLANLAALRMHQGRHGEAEALYEQALETLERAPSVDAGTRAVMLTNLAFVLMEQGRREEAEVLYRKLLALPAGPAGPGAQGARQAGDPIQIRNNLAVLLRQQGRLAEAEALYRQVLGLVRQSLGPRHPWMAVSLSNLALVLMAQGNSGEAERLYRQALRIFATLAGGPFPEQATCLSNLASLEAARGHDEQAETLERQALAIRETLLSADHPDSALSRNHLALLALLRGRMAEARSQLIALHRQQAVWLRRELPLQPRALRLAQLQTQPDAIASTFALLDQDPASAPLALETRLNRQGLLAEIEQRQRLLLGSSPETRQLGERLAGLDRQLASVSLTASQREQLRSQRQQLEGDLNRLLPALRIEPVSTQQVADALKSLAPQGLLVEFQKFRPLQANPNTNRPGAGAAGWGPPRYVALLLHPDGRITSIPLGPAAPIDQAIDKALVASAANSAYADGLWGQVSSLVFTPLAPELRGFRELFLSPDGALHRVPYAALPAPGSGGQRLNQAFQLRLLTTGRELIRLRQPAAAGSAPVLIANPDYNALSRSAAATGSSGPSRGSSTSRGSAADNATASAASMVAPAPTERQQRSGTLASTTPWAPLPGTALEAQALAPLLGIPQPITGAAATAPLVLRQNAPRILHIATHGFFQPDLPSTPSGPLAGAPSGSTPAPARQEDPLLRSGLVFAGANHPEADPSDDGYLTAAEVTGINLKGTQLVTLSACESGLGDLQSGEGVYGLQRSLAVAGARSTLLSLWQVDDDATRAFMQAFYGRLLRGEGRADALAHTQAEFRIHPNLLYRDLYVWAAFQLTGDWRPISSDR